MSNSKPAHGTVCWNELVTRDTHAAARFYTELLGWKPIDSGMPGMTYTIFKAHERDIGGMMAMPAGVPSEVPSHWMTYFAVDDVDASTKRATELGGEIVHGPQDVPDVGRFYIIRDPTGAVMTLITML